jgi:hypothetical protein
VLVFSVTASTTPGTLTNSGWTVGCNRTQEDGHTERELVVAVANHHCDGQKPYLCSMLYQVFFSKIIHPTVSDGGQLFKPQRVEDLRKRPRWNSVRMEASKRGLNLNSEIETADSADFMCGKSVFGFWVKYY